jgi:predicted RNA-binding Zn-ribbon protein involved in translation (DUF1610 family)
MADPPVQDCASCGAEIAPGDDFCRECGHSVNFGQRLADGELDDDLNAGVICPSCGATHLVRTSDGRFVCETCGYQL